MNVQAPKYFYGIPVRVKYLGPTNTQGSRYKAIVKRNAAIVSYDYGKDQYHNQLAAVTAAVEKWIEEDDFYDGFEVVSATDGHFNIVLTASST